MEGQIKLGSHRKFDKEPIARGVRWLRCALKVRMVAYCGISSDMMQTWWCTCSLLLRWYKKPQEFPVQQRSSGTAEHLEQEPEETQPEASCSNMTSKLAVALLAAFLLSAALCEGEHTLLLYTSFLCLNVMLR